jgi:hypothetical protein
MSAVMSDAELRRRRKAQAALSMTTASIGLSALGAKGTAGALRKVSVGQKKIGNVVRAKQLKGAAKKVDQHVTTALTAGAGLGGIGGFNYAAITNAEARKRVSKARIPTRGAGFLRRGVTNSSGTEHWMEVGRKDNPWRVTTKEYPNQGVKTKGKMKKMPVAVTAGLVGGYGTIGGVTAWQAHKKKMQTVKKAYDPERSRQKRLRGYEDTSRKVGLGASIGAAVGAGALAGRDATVNRLRSRLNEADTIKTPQGKTFHQAVVRGQAKKTMAGRLRKVEKLPGFTRGRSKAVVGVAGLGVAGQVASNRIEHYRRGKGRSYQSRVPKKPQ